MVFRYSSPNEQSQAQERLPGGFIKSGPELFSLYALNIVGTSKCFSINE